MVNVEIPLFSRRLDLLDGFVSNVFGFIESYETLRTFINNPENVKNLKNPVEMTFVFAEMERDIQLMCGYSESISEEMLDLQQNIVSLGAARYFPQNKILREFSGVSDRLEAVSYACDVSFHITHIFQRIVPYYHLISDTHQNDINTQPTIDELQNDTTFVKYKLLLVQNLLSDIRSQGLDEYYPEKELDLFESFIDVLYRSSSVIEILVDD